MGMAVGGGGKLQADINVVPLVDITLVLLIIFMVMTPMMQRGYDMSIPEKSEKTTLTDTSTANQMVVRVEPGPGDVGIVFLNNERKARTDDAQTLQQLSTLLGDHVKGRRKAERIVFFQANDDVRYQAAVICMDLIRTAGGQVGLVTTEM